VHLCDSTRLAIILVDVPFFHPPWFGALPLRQFGVVPVFVVMVIACAGTLAFLLISAFAPIFPDTLQTILQFGVLS